MLIFFILLQDIQVKLKLTLDLKNVAKSTLRINVAALKFRITKLAVCGILLFIMPREKIP